MNAPHFRCEDCGADLGEAVLLPAKPGGWWTWVAPPAAAAHTCPEPTPSLKEDPKP